MYFNSFKAASPYCLHISFLIQKTVKALRCFKWSGRVGVAFSLLHHLAMRICDGKLWQQSANSDHDSLGYIVPLPVCVLWRVGIWHPGILFGARACRIISGPPLLIIRERSFTDTRLLQAIGYVTVALKSFRGGYCSRETKNSSGRRECTGDGNKKRVLLVFETEKEITTALWWVLRVE